MKNMYFNFKIYLEDKVPPLSIKVSNELQPGKTLNLFTSHEIKEPTFEANHNKYVNPKYVKINCPTLDDNKF